MGLIGPIGPIGLIRLMGLMGLMGFWGSCSEEQVVEPVVKQQVAVEVHPYVLAYEDIAMTRAWLPPTDYFLVAGTEDNSIGIAFTQDGQEPEYGHFFKSGETWRSSVNITTAGTYYLYGYAPHTTGMSCEISSSETPNDNSAYSDGAVLTIKNVPAVTPNDVCVLVGAKNGKDDYKADPLDFSVTGLVPGQFEYEAQTMGPGGGANYAFLLFDHLFSSLQLRFNLNAEYAALRSIKIKELGLRTYSNLADDGSVNMKKYDVTIKLQKTLDGSSPIVKDNGGNDIITFLPSSVPGNQQDVNGTVFFTSDGGENLPVEPGYTTFFANFVPAGVKKLVLTSTYDVYDNKGNKIREGCTAENTIKLNIFNGQTETFRGRRYTIELTVNPTYLYMMSDPDLDNPTLEIK